MKKQTENQPEKQVRKKSAKGVAETQVTENAQDGTPSAASAPKTRVPRLSPELRAQAQAIIDKRERNAAGKPQRKRGEPKETLCVFAFRLTPAERDLIHKAAGAAKASRFVRALAVAGAAGDTEAVKLILEHVTAN